MGGCQGQGYHKRSKVKYIGQNLHRSKLTTFKLLHIEIFIFGIHVYLMEPHILGSDVSRSMSPFKVKGQIYMQVKSLILI